MLRDRAWWAHRDDVAGARKFAFRALPKTNIGSVDPYALKSPAPKGRHTHQRRALPLHFTPIDSITEPKKIENHIANIALHYMHYNFCRIHQALRVTPAMEAGTSSHVWNL